MSGAEVRQELPKAIKAIVFSKEVRVPGALTREVRAKADRVLFLANGCVCIRQQVARDGQKKVVETVAIPISGGLVERIEFEDQPLEAPEATGARAPPTETASSGEKVESTPAEKTGPQEPQSAAASRRGQSGAK